MISGFGIFIEMSDGSESESDSGGFGQLDPMWSHSEGVLRILEDVGISSEGKEDLDVNPY